MCYKLILQTSYKARQVGLKNVSEHLTITSPTSANKMMATKGNKGYYKLRPWRRRSHVRLSIVFPMVGNQLED